MTDRELLELAAKAAGIELDYLVCDLNPPYYINVRGGHSSWNPLESAEDAFQLAMALRIQYRFINTHCAGVEAYNGSFPACYERLGVDCSSAVRRAIVRVAAELGGMK